MCFSLEDPFKGTLGIFTVIYFVVIYDILLQIGMVKNYVLFKVNTVCLIFGLCNKNYLLQLCIILQAVLNTILYTVLYTTVDTLL